MSFPRKRESLDFKLDPRFREEGKEEVLSEPADFKITRDGTWYHDGAPIKREALAKLFSDRALKIDEDGKYWLQTPFEKYPVEVEDVPFVVVDYDGLTLRTNMNDHVAVGDQTVWQLRDGIPYIEIRDGLFARIGRAVLYNLIEEHGKAIEVDGKIFPLGEL